MFLEKGSYVGIGILEIAHNEALEILERHRSTLDLLAGALLERETLDDSDLAVIFEGLDAYPVSGPTEDGDPRNQ